MAAGKIHKRADVDHDRTRRLLVAKFVDGEQREPRWLHAIQAGSVLVYFARTEEVGRVGAKAVEERVDEGILPCRDKQRVLASLFPEGRRPLPAGAGRAERARSVGWVDSEVVRKPAQTPGGAVEVTGERMGLLRPDQVGAGSAAREDGSSTEQRQRV